MDFTPKAGGGKGSQAQLRRRTARLRAKVRSHHFVSKGGAGADVARRTDLGLGAGVRTDCSAAADVWMGL